MPVVTRPPLLRILPHRRVTDEEPELLRQATLHRTVPPLLVILLRLRLILQAAAVRRARRVTRPRVLSIRRRVPSTLRAPLATRLLPSLPAAVRQAAGHPAAGRPAALAAQGLARRRAAHSTRPLLPPSPSRPAHLKRGAMLLTSANRNEALVGLSIVVEFIPSHYSLF